MRCLVDMDDGTSQYLQGRGRKNGGFVYVWSEERVQRMKEGKGKERKREWKGDREDKEGGHCLRSQLRTKLPLK